MNDSKRLTGYEPILLGSFIISNNDVLTFGLQYLYSCLGYCFCKCGFLFFRPSRIQRNCDYGHMLFKMILHLFISKGYWERLYICKNWELIFECNISHTKVINTPLPYLNAIDWTNVYIFSAFSIEISPMCTNQYAKLRERSSRHEDSKLYLLAISNSLVILSFDI